MVHDIPLIGHSSPAFASVSGRSSGAVKVRFFGRTPPARRLPCTAGGGNVSGTSTMSTDLSAAVRSSMNVRALIDLYVTGYCLCVPGTVSRMS